MTAGRTIRSHYSQRRQISDFLPGAVSGYLDWHLRPQWRGGVAFNGQARRAELFEELVRAFSFAAIVETGTYRGLTTLHMRRVSGLPVYTVEANSRAHHFARMRFVKEPGIRAECGDSRRFLKDLTDDPTVPHGCVFFYLDAHSTADLPLWEEVEIIDNGWADPVIMIDDFQVPGDPGYEFDDYGERNRLSADQLPSTFKREFRLFWPSAPSAKETGSRRGCVVAGRRALAARKLAESALLNETVCYGGV